MPMNKAQTPPTTLFDGHLRPNVGRFSHFEENVGVATEMAAWNAKSYRCILSQRFPLRSEDPLCLTSRSKLQAWDKFLVSSAPICQGWWKMFPIYPPLDSPWKFDAWKMIHFLFMAKGLGGGTPFQDSPSCWSFRTARMYFWSDGPQKNETAAFLQRQKEAKAEFKRIYLFWKWWSFIIAIVHWWKLYWENLVSGGTWGFHHPKCPHFTGTLWKVWTHGLR